MAKIILRPTNLHWISEAADDPSDLCAHSPVYFQIDDNVLIEPADGDWTVSASALYLLRSLSQPHPRGEGIGDQLFPCCGNGIFEVEGKDDVLILGCNSGVDFEIIQKGDQLQLTTSEGANFLVPMLDWRAAVFGFADAVRSFYEVCSTKIPEDDFEKKSFEKFLSEWSRRRRLT